MAQPKVVSMERTPEERKEAEGRVAEMPSAGPDYPWGLCLNLGKDELEKLGITKLPAVGDEFHIFGVACVTRVSQSASAGGEDSKGVELQITDLCVMPEDEGEEGGMSAAAKKLYGDEAE